MDVLENKKYIAPRGIRTWDVSDGSWSDDSEEYCVLGCDVMHPGETLS